MLRVKARTNFSTSKMLMKVNHHACLQRLLFAYVDTVDPVGRVAIRRSVIGMILDFIVFRLVSPRPVCHWGGRWSAFLLQDLR
jgi:hypothetical protein